MPEIIRCQGCGAVLHRSVDFSFVEFWRNRVREAESAFQEVEECSAKYIPDKEECRCGVKEEENPNQLNLF